MNVTNNNGLYTFKTPLLEFERTLENEENPSSDSIPSNIKTEEETSLIDSSIPEDVMNVVVSYCNLPERNKMMLVSKKWNSLVDAKIHWLAISKLLHNNLLQMRNQSLDDKNKIKNLVQRNNNCNRFYITMFFKQSVRDEINELYNKKLIINNIDLLQSFFNARNCLIMGKILQNCPNTVGNLNLDLQNFNSVEEVIEKAEEFKGWCRTNQSILSQITELNLARKMLTSLPAEILQFLPNLIHLYLYRNEITSLPGELFQLTNLQSLNLGFNKISSLPHEFFQLTNLQSLCLSNNNITSLPIEIFQMANLRSLNLSCNKITSLSIGIFQSANLETLNLNWNKLTSLPIGIFQMTNLQSLHLSNNKITSLPIEFSQLKNLQSLDLSYNNITALPIEFLQLAKLQNLFIGSQHVMWISVPNEFWKSPLRTVTYGVSTFANVQKIGCALSGAFTAISAYFSKDRNDNNDLTDTTDLNDFVSWLP